ncbi:ATPase, T2SS/T4P/T4SS family [Haladaptatus salinisoli]|uniref:ATPase, T2SS/T4P/T4SS family n=1 Tax=Haladaptatus salinisoli TaxID=2884876 RepID=UPI001D09C706|nr:ATPase, T2SS/T4P/T4SS family [Haladaptatus salinisoli]
MASEESEALGGGGPEAGPDGVDFSGGVPARVALGTYTWEDFKEEFFYEDGRPPTNWRGKSRPFPAEEFLGFDPDETESRVGEAARRANALGARFEAFLDPEETPVTVGEYLWEHFRYEYYYDPDREKPHEKPRDEDGNVVEFEKSDWLGFEEDDLPNLLAEGAAKAERLLEIEDERTLDVPDDLDEDAFFSTVEGYTTVVNRYDLEKAVALPKKTHFREIDRYWVNKPYSFVVVFHSEKENEQKYYLVEPYCTRIEDDLREFLTGKLRTSIKYSSDDVVVDADEEDREAVIERETLRLLSRYDLHLPGDAQIAELLRGTLSGYDDARDTWNRYAAETRAQTGEAIRTLRERTAPYLERFGEDEKEPERDEADDGADASESVEESDANDVDEESGEQERDSTSEADEPREPATELDESAEPTPEPDGAERSTPETDETGTVAAAPSRFDGLRARWDDLLAERVGDESLRRAVRTRVEEAIAEHEADDEGGELDGIMARPEPALLEEDADTLTEYQVEKLLYLLKRDFIGYERIDGIKHDINVEDISCDGYNSPVFVYHTDYEQVITNVHHGESELDDFVVKLAQRSGKGISKRQPQVDATLPDGSRAQLTLGREVSDHGTNYTVRQFKDVPFTPIDLVNWNTFSLDEMAFLWLAIENHRSLIFAGGTASGKTTSLNAVSLFIPSNTKIVSIEDTREVELPQRNWIASVTRPSFSDDDKGDVDEFDLLEAALRQRPDYIVMGEIRGEEGRTLFQVMSTGHTTYTTFHADTVGEVLKRFTTEPINVSKTLFTALDLVSVQTQTRVKGSKVRRTKSITEINHYDTENDEINVKDVFQWRAETDEHEHLTGSNTLEEIKFDRGWDQARLEEELLKRRTILAYLIHNGLNEYTQVAATVQAFINDPDTILALVANEKLEDSLADLREMESVLIDIDPEKEEMVPRPDPDGEVADLSKDILAEADDELLDRYRGVTVSEDELAVALAETANPTDDRAGGVERNSALDADPFGEFEEATFAEDDGGATPTGDEATGAGEDDE